MCAWLLTVTMNESIDTDISVNFTCICGLTFIQHDNETVKYFHKN